MITEDTNFMIASVSKVVTGMAILKLAALGTIGLDDDICKALPAGYNDNDNSACRNPSFPNTKITWRMLMTHTSSMTGEVPSSDDGFPGYGSTGGWGGEAIGNPSCTLTGVTVFFRDPMIDKATETAVGNIGATTDWYDLANDTV